MESFGGKEAYSQESGGGSGVAFNFFALLLLIFTALGTSCLFFHSLPSQHPQNEQQARAPTVGLPSDAIATRSVSRSG